MNHFKPGILAWSVGDQSAETFKPVWAIAQTWQCYFYVTDGWKVYPGFIPEGDQIDPCGRGKYSTSTLSGSIASQDPVLLEIRGDVEAFYSTARTLLEIPGGPFSS